MVDLLQKIIDKQLYVFADEFNDWKDAITCAAGPLLEKKMIERGYIDDLIKSVEKYGPYIVIDPGRVAMPHSTLGNTGVHETVIGFMRVECPVVFDGNDGEVTARIFFTLAAVDADQHLQNMQALMDILMIDGLIDELIECKNVDDLQAVHDKYFSKK